MKHKHIKFSLVKNDLNTESPQGFILAYGNKHSGVSYFDYDGNADRKKPSYINSEWFPLSNDRDSIMAWHGERKKINGVEYGKVNWM